MPGGSALRTTSRIRGSLSFFSRAGRTLYVRFGRLKLVTTTSGSRIFSERRMSSLTRGVAVAVKARTGGLPRAPPAPQREHNLQGARARGGEVELLAPPGPAPPLYLPALLRREPGVERGRV